VVTEWDGAVSVDRTEFASDPLAWLLSASRGAPYAILRRDGPMMARAPNATGSVAVFGPDGVRTVLTDIETFGMPVSVSERHDLPAALANLNRAIFSMTGPAHRTSQRLLATVLGPSRARYHDEAIDRGMSAFLTALDRDKEIRLIDQMRRLARLVAEEVLFGSSGTDAPLGRELQRYFDQRRRFTTSADAGERAELVNQGLSVDALLRARVRELRVDTSDRAESVIGQLCRRASDSTVSEDELVAHSSVLFMSSSEPIATAMTWIVLALTQRPDLGDAIREESASGGAGPWLAGTVREVLRLAPPSAILMRVTRAAARIGDLELPPGCEVILCPYAEHRRADDYPDPSRLEPQRWSSPSMLGQQLLAFGGGARACLGRRIAFATLERATRALVAAGAPVLAHAQELDWRMDITLLPSTDPVVLLHRLGGVPTRPPQLSGSAGQLLCSTAS